MAGAFILLALCWVFGLASGNNSNAWFGNVSTNLFYLQGDIVLGGLFPINSITSNLSDRLTPNDIACERLRPSGLGASLVMKYTVDEINANQALLPGIKLGYEIFDTCSQSATLVKSTIYLLSDKDTGELAVECNYTDYEPRVAAIIGPYTSEMVTVVGNLLGFFLMPQISYGATSTMFSDNLLFPSFMRTVPDDRLQAMAIVQLLIEFDWKWLVIVGSDDEYGRQGLQEISTLSENTSLCIAYKGRIPVYTDPYAEIKIILDNIEITEAGVVVVFSGVISAEIFFKEVMKRNMTAVWIASTAWALDSTLTNMDNMHTIGTIIGLADNTGALPLFASYAEELFTKISQTTDDPEPTQGATHSKDPCPQCANLSPANLSLATNTYIQHSGFSVYAAVYTAAHALHTLLNCDVSSCTWTEDSKVYPWMLMKELRKTTFELNGIQMSFDSSGNPDLGYILVEWFWENGIFKSKTVGQYHNSLSLNKSLLEWHTDDNQVPQSTCSSNCGAGQVRRVKGFHSCCFDCIDCMAGTFQAINDDIQCRRCPRGQWSLVRSTNCTDPTFEYLTWSQPESLGLMFAALMLIVCHSCVGALFLKHRGTPLVKASGGFLSGLALLCLGASCLSLLLFLGQPGNMVCRLQMPLNSILPTVALATITIISLRMFYMTEFPEKAVSHLDVIKRVEGWLVLACCCVEAGICGWFTQTVPLLSQYLADMDIHFVSEFLVCPVELLGLGLLQGFNTGMALISFMCTFMAVKPIHQYNLARDITFSTLLYCVIWVVFIPIYTGLNDKFKSIIYMIFSLGSNIGLVAAYYFPKCYMLLKKPELNTDEYFRSYLEGAPPRPLEEEQPNQAPETSQESELKPDDPHKG
ncbi:taste receptor type 1 member 3 [Gadus morhua]|uniref:taste receptor type 1 member 3 n=1 Tax=Gadus morhua TaxID=8049 RepID=UPI0011B7FB67|nr:taste receptor type 1 member 3 [Gadus morhua]